MKGLFISLLSGAITGACVIGLGYVVCPMDHTANRFLTADSLLQVRHDFSRMRTQLIIHQRALDLVLQREDITTREEALRVATNFENTLNGQVK